MSKFEANLTKAEQFLARFRKDGVLNHIAGKSVAAVSGATFANTTPVDNSHLAHVAKSDAADIDAAVRAAQESFPRGGRWMAPTAKNPPPGRRRHRAAGRGNIAG